MADRFTLQSGGGIIELQSSTDDLILQSNADGGASQPSTARRSALMTSVIAAAWSLVVATPLFATVGLQTQIDNPPTRLEDKRQAVVRIWEPTTWNAQRAKFAPDKSAPVTGVPFVREDIAGRWAELTWDIPQPRKAPIPDAVVVAAQVPFKRPSFVDQWTPSDWQTQYTRKVSTAGPELFTMPHADAGWKSIALWPQDQWDTQAIRKTPIPDAVVAPGQVPSVRAWLYDRWPQPGWASQQAPPSAISGPGPQVDSHPPRNNIYAIVSAWPEPDYQRPRLAKVTPSGPAVGNQQPAFTRPHLVVVLQSWDQATQIRQRRAVVLESGPEPPVIPPEVPSYPGYPVQGPKVTYTGPPPMVTASKNSPYLIGNPYRKTHNNGPHWPS